MDDLRLGAQALLGQPHLLGQLRQVVTTDVAQLDPFEVVPDPLVRVEVRRIAGQLLQMQAMGGAVAQEVFDDVAAVDRRPIPDHGDVAGDLVEQRAQESHHPAGVIRLFLEVEKEVARERDAADDREMVARQRDAQYRGLAGWRPGAHRQRQQVERRLVYPDDGGLLFVGPFLMAGQRSSAHCRSAASLRWVARARGCWRLHPR